MKNRIAILLAVSVLMFSVGQGRVEAGNSFPKWFAEKLLLPIVISIVTIEYTANRLTIHEYFREEIMKAAKKRYGKWIAERLQNSIDDTIDLYLIRYCVDMYDAVEGGAEVCSEMGEDILGSLVLSSNLLSL